MAAAALQVVACAHCKKEFTPQVLGANTRRAGFKCPHCKLYMPVARANEAA